MSEERSNLDAMKNSLRDSRQMGHTNRVSKTFDIATYSGDKSGAISPQEFFPSRMREKKLRKKSAGSLSRAMIIRIITYLTLVMIGLGIFCFFDLTEYRQWVAATQVLSVLRSNAGDKASSDELMRLADAVDVKNTELKSAIAGILAIRMVGFGSRDAGFRQCKEVCTQFPQSWFAGQFSEKSFYSPCQTCKAKGNVVVPCYHCHGTGKCPRCGGSGDVAYPSGTSRPGGSGGDIRNTGKFIGMGEKCLACHGAMTCMKCHGKGTLTGNCSECGGVGDFFSKPKTIEQYRSVIDHVSGLHPSWVADIVRLQTSIKTWLPFF